MPEAGDWHPLWVQVRSARASRREVAVGPPDLARLAGRVGVLMDAGEASLAAAAAWNAGGGVSVQRARA